MREYEIKFEKAYPTYQSEKIKYDFFEAESPEEAIEKLQWKYGAMVSVISISIF